MSLNLWLELSGQHEGKISEKLDTDNLMVWEKRIGLEYYLQFAKRGSREGVTLDTDNVFILGNALLDWVENIKGKDWFGSVETVFEFGKTPYVKKKEKGDIL